MNVLERIEIFLNCNKLIAANKKAAETAHLQKETPDMSQQPKPFLLKDVRQADVFIFDGLVGAWTPAETRKNFESHPAVLDSHDIWSANTHRSRSFQGWGDVSVTLVGHIGQRGN